MNLIKEYAGVVALVILAIMSLSGLVGHKGLTGTTSCGSITCLEGGLRLVSDVGGDFESDVAATFASTVNITGVITAGVINATSGTFSSTLKVAGVLSVATTTPSTLGDVVISSSGTTTLMLGSSSGTKGTCFQVLNSVGALTAIVVNGTTIAAVAGSCK